MNCRTDWYLFGFNILAGLLNLLMAYISMGSPWALLSAFAAGASFTGAYWFYTSRRQTEFWAAHCDSLRKNLVWGNSTPEQWRN